MAWILTGLWFFHTVIAINLAAPFLYYGAERAQWRAWEFTAFVVPYLTWATAMLIDSSNMNFDASLFLIPAIPVAAAIRVWIGAGKWQNLVSALLIAALCGVALAIYFLTPSLPE